MNEENDFRHRPFRGVIVILDGLIKYRVWGKGIIPYVISFNPKKLVQKVGFWSSEGLSFREVKN